ncbi:hypothetical protein BRAS3843_120092 [Bradyrhizobium sp. STM 3843]|nr:hypothetical protein BRAS3843_120092 [Bradyrhizobium sp. STM 3843]
MRWTRSGLTLPVNGCAGRTAYMEPRQAVVGNEFWALGSVGRPAAAGRKALGGEGLAQRD